MSETDWAWAAGLFEGEGSIIFDGMTSVCLSVAMTDVDVIQKFHDVVAVGKQYTHTPKQPGRKQVFIWRSQVGPEVDSLLHSMMPYFGIRRYDKASEALVRLASNPGHPSTRSQCINGHDFYVDLAGKRRCRICAHQRLLDKKARSA